MLIYGCIIKVILILLVQSCQLDQKQVESVNWTNRTSRLVPSEPDGLINFIFFVCSQHQNDVVLMVPASKGCYFGSYKNIFQTLPRFELQQLPPYPLPTHRNTHVRTVSTNNLEALQNFPPPTVTTSPLPRLAVTVVDKHT